uniref:Interferon lambda receptor 1 isoform X1 n=1 Tax=Pogona vitticeps TaxID=103695 RepID=A0ABM5ET19_9SAUR
MSHLRIGALVFLAFFSQVTAQVLLPHPRDLTLLSKDFSLFLSWLPDDSYPSGVSYTVQWRDPYDAQWEDVPHCRDISGRSCNITCVPRELHNRYWVRIRAQMRSRAGMASSAWVELKDIDYALYVEPAPPMLQVHETENIVRVNATFLYPSCAKDILQHQVYYNLETWEAGTEKKNRYERPEANVIELNMMQWPSGNYCFHARSYFQTNEKWSHFSRPVCTQLHGKGILQGAAENWTLIFLPLLLVVSAGPLSVYVWCRHKLKQAKTPQALDFSTFNSPKKLFEFGTMEEIVVDVLLCTGLPLDAGKRNRLPHQITRSPVCSLAEDDDEDEEDEDDSGGPIPYTEMHRFKKKDRDFQVGLDQKALDPSSQSGNAQPHGECWPVVMMPGPFDSIEWVTEKAVSGFSESLGASLLENSSMDDPLNFPITSPVARGEGQEDANSDIDFWPRMPRLTEGLDLVSPTRRQFMAARDHPEATCGQLDVSWLLEEQLINQESFEKDVSNCRELREEIPLLMASCKEDLENETLGGDGDSGVLSRSRFHGYEPKHIPYIARAQVG